MTENKEKKHLFEPLFHIAKLTDRGKMFFLKSMLVRVLAVIAALLVSAAFAWIFYEVKLGDVINSIYKGSFGTSRKIWTMLKDVALLLGVALALTPAFKMKFWNIGGEGQILAGALATYACSYYLNGAMSEPLLIIVMLLAGILAGAVWGFIPAIFKALWNTNETLFTLMMNYVAIQLVSFFIGVWATSGSNTLEMITKGLLPEVIHKNFLSILIVAVVTVLMFIYLKYTKQGYEISVVGESERTAKYVGINVKKIVVRTMIISGAICGLIGFLLVSAFDRTLSIETANGRGFTAIMVSWLGKFNPFYMVITSFVLIFLDRGGAQMNTDFGVGAAMSEIIIAIILLFIIGCEFFLNYKIVINDRYKFKRKSKKEGTAK